MPVRAKMQETKEVTKQTFKEWKDDDGLQWGAALAYYTVFALGPMLFITILLAGLIFSPGVVQDRIEGEVSATLGEEAGAFITQMVSGAMRAGDSPVAVTIGIIALVVAATGAFAQLSIALNRMWDIRADPKRGWLMLLKKRAMAFGFVIVVGLLLVATLIASAILRSLGDLVEGITPATGTMLWIAGEVVTVGAMMLLFAMIFRYLPDADIGWHEVWLGAFVTALLFEAGKLLFGLYVSFADVGSGFGAAGSLIVILIWVWFASQLVFFGAEFTQVHARRHGKRIQPEPHAVRMGRPGKRRGAAGVAKT